LPNTVSTAEVVRNDVPQYQTASSLFSSQTNHQTMSDFFDSSVEYAMGHDTVSPQAAVLDSPDRDSSVESVKTEIPTQETVQMSDSPQINTAENLRQISLQLEGLVNEADVTAVSDSIAVGADTQQTAMVRALQERNSMLKQQLQDQQLYGQQVQQQLQQLSQVLQAEQQKAASNPQHLEGTATKKSKLEKLANDSKSN